MMQSIQNILLLNFVSLKKRDTTPFFKQQEFSSFDALRVLEKPSEMVKSKRMQGALKSKTKCTTERRSWVSLGIRV